MATSNKDFCNLCYDDGTSTEAVTWCTECEVFLCTDCGKHHKKSRLSRDHKTMFTKDYHKLPKLMQEFSVHCHYHKKKFEIYCPFHDCPCCVQCVTDKHQKCQEMKPLSDILKKVKSSTSIHLLEKELQDVKGNFEKMSKYLNRRLDISNHQEQKGLYEIQCMRSMIDAFLNKLEQKLIDDLKSQHSKLTLKINTLLKQLKQQTEKISQLQNQFCKITQYATELQMYVSLREIEKTTSQAAQYIEDLQNGDNFDEKYLEVTISSELQSILKYVKSFGDINTNSRPSTFQVKDGRKYQAQYLHPTFPGIERIKPSLLRQLTFPVDIKNDVMFACRILPDGKYLVFNSDYDYKYLALFSNDGIFIRKVVTFTSHLNDVCYVRDNTVAVTLKSKNQTALVDVEKNKIIKVIHLSHTCYAVTSDGQILVVSGYQKSTIVNLNDESHKILEGVGGVCIAYFKGNIYGTIDEKVCCYKGTGEPLWTRNLKEIHNPYGLALDKNGFIYIGSKGNNKMVVVSPDGKTFKPILSAADEIESPEAMDINSERGIMIVSSRRWIDCDDSDDDDDHFLSYDDCVNKTYQTAFIYKI